MARQRAPTYACMLEYARRQLPRRWGQHYEPAIKAVRSEAPSSSHCFLLKAIALNRDVHALSIGERNAALHALWHPGLLELQEQRVLWPMATEHPLHGSPYVRSRVELPPLHGTFAVAKRLQIAHNHPTVKGPKEAASSVRSKLLPFPLVGDLLLFLQDELGPYCVNWNIKDDHSSFKKQTHGSLRRRSSDNARNKVADRQRIERELYADAHVPTIEIAQTDFDPIVVANLLMLLPIRVSGVPFAATRDLDLMLNEGLEEERPPIETFSRVIQRHRVTQLECIEVAKQLVWAKRVPVDLYKPVLWDQPLSIPQRCVIKEHVAWFRRWA